MNAWAPAPYSRLPHRLIGRISPPISRGRHLIRQTPAGPTRHVKLKGLFFLSFFSFFNIEKMSIHYVYLLLYRSAKSVGYVFVSWFRSSSLISWPWHLHVSIRLPPTNRFLFLPSSSFLALPRRLSDMTRSSIREVHGECEPQKGKELARPKTVCLGTLEVAMRLPRFFGLVLFRPGNSNHIAI